MAEKSSTHSFAVCQSGRVYLPYWRGSIYYEVRFSIAFDY